MTARRTRQDEVVHDGGVTAPLRLAPDRGLVRGVRAGVLTVPAVGTAVVAHAAADGCGSVFAVLLALGLCWPAAVAALGVRRQVPALLAWVLGAQAVTHVLLDALCGDPRSGLVGHLTPAMLVAHGVAAVLIGLLLGRADAGLWTAQALLRAGARVLRLGQQLPRPAVPAPVRRTSAGTVVVPPASWEVAQPTRRGPPAFAASAS